MNKKKIFKYAIMSMLFLLSIFYNKTVKAETYTGQAIWSSEYISNIYIKKVKPDGYTKYQQARFIRRSEDNQFVYCLQPYIDIDNNLPYYNVIRQDYETVLGITQEQWRRISLLAYYGYQYNENGYNHSDNKWYAITQVMIWRTTNPESDIYFTDTLNGSRTNKFDSEMAELENLISSHYFKPSFSTQEQSMYIGSTITLNDTNNVLSNYTISNTNNVSAKIEGNNLVITANGIGAGSITLKKTATKYTIPPVVYVKDGSQNVMRVGQYDPVLATLNINIYGGKVIINKVGEKVELTDNGYVYTNEVLEGVKFCIYSKDGKELKCGLTNKEGKLIFTNLELGDYYVQEIETLDGYILDNTKHEISLKYKDQYTEVITYETLIENKLPKGTLEFTKTDFSESITLPNTKMEIYTENDKLVYTGITDENGKIVINELPIGKYYILEKEAPEGYTLNEEKMYFEIKEDGEIVKCNMRDEQIIEVPNTYAYEFPFIELGSLILCLFGIGVLIYANKKKK